MGTMARIGAAYSAETFKTLRQRQWIAGPLLIVAITLGMLLPHPMTKTVSGYAFIADAVSVSVCTVGFLLVLLFSASLVAPEADSGVLRGVLARPVLRRDVLIAKWLLGCTYAGIVLLAGAGTAWALALTLSDLTGVTFGGELIHGQMEMRNTFVLAVAGSFVPLAAAVSFGLMFSVLARTAGGAFVGTFIIWMALEAVKYPFNMASFVFSTHIETPWLVFRGYCAEIDVGWFPDMWYCLGASAGTCVVCLLVSFVAFERRNFS
jgi:ABC-type transport system involved in multi-copper enzyme maturation permease subunit